MSPEDVSEQKEFRRSKMNWEFVEVGDLEEGEGVGSTATATGRNSVNAWRAT